MSRLGSILPIGLILQLYLVLSAAVVAESGQTTPSKAPDRTITVELLSGRAVTAQLDARTDSSRLWLRHGGATQYILRPIAWDRVVRVRTGTETLSRDEFLATVTRARSDTPGRTDEQSPRRIVLRGRPPEKDGPTDTATTVSTSRLTTIRQTGSDQRPVSRVQSLAIDARVANWDADPEVDGLIVDVYPLDAEGHVVPVRGSLEVNLTGWRRTGSRSRRPLARIGRWTKRVDPSDFDAGVAHYKLAFQAVHPEFDLDWVSYGEVHARLGVPGHGTFEAIGGSVRIRSYSPIRDQLQHLSGRRFFPSERTGR